MMKKKSETTIFIVRTSVLLIILFCLIGLHKMAKDKVKEQKIESDTLYQKGYFDGQKAVMEGNVKIIQVRDTVNNLTKWVWLNDSLNIKSNE